MSASLAVQRMVAAALAAVPGITGVHDGPPVDAVSPYLVIGADVVTDWSTKTETGHEHRIGVTAWVEGPAAASAKAIIGAVETALAGLAGTRDGHRLVSVRLLRSLVLTDPEGWSQGIIEFRLRTVAA
ncbi:DUF3168 domain-containing protein [Sandarakinorhabdus sp. DWP1-3-1]|uniref:DUF3168 domain-containing protein n=1 Tax=Sandarakinorhabdus sp. DWP1-3-1 TaxID=2804627 RepID=UPI003CEA901C